MSGLLDIDLFTLFVIIWGILGIVSAVPLFFTGAMPISGRNRNRPFAKLGTINKKTGWIVMELPILIAVIGFYLAGSQGLNLSALMVAAFVIHYSNRALIYPHRIKADGKTMPVIMVLSTMAFYTVNGFMIGHYFGSIRVYPPGWLFDSRFIIGAAMFVTGFLINLHSDNILIHLRKPGETGYKIPEGGLFRFVSCPHYFGEVIEWIGFALMTWSLPGLVYAIWVILPLLAQGISAHRWYLKKFGDQYPKKRKAIIPGVL